MWRVALSLVRQNPIRAVTVALALGRGTYYRGKFRLFGQRVVMGGRFRVVGRLDIKGPGTVIFGDDCTVRSSRYAATTPYTHSPDAIIQFGNEVTLSGTRIGCLERVQVGDRALLADARIMDTDFHQMEASDITRATTEGSSEPIEIGPNTWIGAGAMILKGVRIGANSVIGAGTVVTSDVPANVVAMNRPPVLIPLKGAANLSKPVEGGVEEPKPITGAHQ